MHVRWTKMARFFKHCVHAPCQYINTFYWQYTHTHTLLFNGPLSRTTQVSRYQKVKPIWILLKQETVSGSGISWAICKSAPCSRQITTPAPHHSVFYTQPAEWKHWKHLTTPSHNLYTPKMRQKSKNGCCKRGTKGRQLHNHDTRYTSSQRWGRKYLFAPPYNVKCETITNMIPRPSPQISSPSIMSSDTFKVVVCFNL